MDIFRLYWAKPLLAVTVIVGVLCLFGTSFLYRKSLRKSKRIPTVFFLVVMTILMMVCGFLCGLLFNSGLALVIVLTLSLGFVGTIAAGVVIFYLSREN